MQRFAIKKYKPLHYRCSCVSPMVIKSGFRAVRDRGRESDAWSKTAATLAATHRNEHRLFWPSVQLWAATSKYGPDLRHIGRRPCHHALIVAGRANDRPFGSAHCRRDERPNQVSAWATHALLLNRRHSVFPKPVCYALFQQLVDGRIAFVDFGCWQ